MKNEVIAHIRKQDGKVQYLWEHLQEASFFAGKFAQKIDFKEIGEVLGLLHDLGKASAEFQDYIGSANGLIDPDEDRYIDAVAKKGEIDHSSAGAQMIWSQLSGQNPESYLAAQILSLCLASHHSGIINCLSPGGEDKFTQRMNKADDKTHLTEALSNLTEIEINSIHDLLSLDIGKRMVDKLKGLREENESKETLAFKQGLLIRFLFSCLIDADRLSTANFETPGNIPLRNNNEHHSWQMLAKRLEDHLHTFQNNTIKNEVYELRQQVSQACLAFSTKSNGIYQLTVPTGGGKTLASLRFALNHAAVHNMDHVFYIIPFTSIIDQNADQVRKILEDRDESGRFLDKVVLEHHSNLTPEEESRRHSLLSENWDAPVIFTTQVQFLETLFSAGTRGVRRMHQLSNAVIIFDEVQTIPVRCVHMFNLALRFLVHECGSTVVLCTATQPLLDRVEPVQRALIIKPDQKMIPDEKELFDRLKRYEVFDRRKLSQWTDDEVADLVEADLSSKGSVLVVVNTRSSARSLYETILLRGVPAVYHLSTHMCAAHRLDILREVKEKLKNEEPLVCVSTQLIEAGVDIDFGAVIRYLAGLDSITQAAGRCNRNGIRPQLGSVSLLNPKEEDLTRLRDISIGRDISERVLQEFRDSPETFHADMLGPDLLERFYQYYFYDRKAEMCYPVGKNSPVGREDNLFNLLSLNSASVCDYQRISNFLPTIPFRQSFQSAAKAFHAIDSSTQGVIAPYGDEGKTMIADLCGAYEIEKQYKLLKRAQRYSVNLFPEEFKRMADKQAVREVQEHSGIFYLDSQYYSSDFGWLEEAVNPMDLLIV